MLFALLPSAMLDALNAPPMRGEKKSVDGRCRSDDTLGDALLDRPTRREREREGVMLDVNARDARRRAGDEKETCACACTCTCAELHSNHDEESARAEMDVRIINEMDRASGRRDERLNEKDDALNDDVDLHQKLCKHTKPRDDEGATLEKVRHISYNPEFHSRTKHIPHRSSALLYPRVRVESWPCTRYARWGQVTRLVCDAASTPS